MTDIPISVTDQPANEMLLQSIKVIDGRLKTLEDTVAGMAAKMDERDVKQQKAFDDFTVQIKDAQSSLATETEKHFEQMRVRQDSFDKAIAEDKIRNEARDKRIDKLEDMPEQLAHISKRLFGSPDEPDDDSFLKLQKKQFELLENLQKQGDKMLDFVLALSKRVDQMEAATNSNAELLKRFSLYEQYARKAMRVPIQFVVSRWWIWLTTALATIAAIILSKGA